MILLERDELLTELAERRAAAAGGDGVLVWLAGEAGVGKSSVARALADRCGGRVLWGGCDALSTPRPLGPLHDLAGQAPSVAAALAADGPRHQVFTAFLEELATPTLVVIEDAHWADDATVDLLRFVGRRVGATRSLVLVTYRSDEVEGHASLRAVLGDLATSASCRRSAVEPLTPAAVAELAAGHALDPVRVYAVTGGNAFYVTEVLAAARWSVPPTVADAVLARAGRLPAAARTALDVVAIEPGGMELALAAALEVEGTAIDEAVGAGMLVVHGIIARFRHELARLAVAERIPTDRRLRLHRDALGSLEATGGGAARLAHHAEGAGDRDAVLRWAPTAAVEAAQAGAPREAVAQYERALRYAGDADPLRSAELVGALVDQLALVDRLDDALAAAEWALALREAVGDPVAIVRARADVARRLWMTGSGDDAYQLMARATAEAEALPPAAATGPVFAARAYLDMLARRQDAIEWAGRAIAGAEAHGDRRTLAVALNARGSARICVADDVGGIEDLERARRIGEEEGLDAVVADALNNLGSALGEQRRHQLAGPYLESCIAFASARDFEATRRYSEAWLARVRFEQGRWSEASGLLTAELQQEGITPIATMVALAVLGRLRTRRGDPGPAEPLARAWETARRTGDLQRLWPVVAGRVEAAWLRGTVGDDVVADLLDVLELSRGHGVQYAAGELGFWAWKLDLDVPMPADSAPAFAAHVAGDGFEAARLWDELDAPYEAAWALADTGDEAAMREALERFVSLGATPMARRVRRAMRAQGVRDVPRGPRSATADGPSGLTAREVEVLALVAGGLTDREIGERLFVSTKTVGHHVSHVLRKLGARSRVEAATTYAELAKDGEDSRFAT